MATKLYLLRHGATQPNIDGITQDYNNDVPLTEAAMQELHSNMDSIIKQLDVDMVTLLCSPMLRAKQTCIEVHNALLMHGIRHIGVAIKDELKEVDFGKFGGMPDDYSYLGETMQTYRQKTTAAYAGIIDDFEYPDGERLLTIRARVFRLIYFVAQSITQLDMTSKGQADNETNRAYVLIGHNRLFRHILAELYPDYAKNMFDKKLPHAELVELNLYNVYQMYNKICRQMR